VITHDHTAGAALGVATMATRGVAVQEGDMERTRRTRVAGLALSLALGMSAVAVSSQVGAAARTAGGGMTVRKAADGSECQYRPGQLIAPPGAAAVITRVTGTSVKEIANLVPERLRNQLPATVQQYSVYSIGSADPFDAAIGLGQLGMSAAPNYISSFAPGVRTWAPGEEARPAVAPGPIAPSNSYGSDVRVGVIDTGLGGKITSTLPGTGAVTYRSAQSMRLTLVANGLIAPTYLQPIELTTGRAAGHGTFITGLIRRALPGARIVVAQVPFYDGGDAAFGVPSSPGFTSNTSSRADDAALTFMMFSSFVDSTARPNIDVLSLSFGSYGCGDAFETEKGPGDFRTPVGIRSALLGLWELSGRKLKVTAAAGNDQTDEPFYPAAFAASACFEPSNVPPGIPPASCEQKSEAVSPWLAGVSSTPSSLGDYSNLADWAAVLAQGSDVVSLMPNSTWASWSGTSFAAPCAAVYAGLKPDTAWLDIRGQLIDCGLR
jgi:hypothetical protein